MSFIIIFAPKTWQGIRALSIDKDNAPKVLSYTLLNMSRNFYFSYCFLIFVAIQWSPATLEVKNEDIDRLFEPFSSEKELQVPSDDSNRWTIAPKSISFLCPSHKQQCILIICTISNFDMDNAQMEWQIWAHSLWQNFRVIGSRNRCSSSSQACFKYS